MIWAIWNYRYRLILYKQAVTTWIISLLGLVISFNNCHGAYTVASVHVYSITSIQNYCSCPPKNIFAYMWLMNVISCNQGGNQYFNCLFLFVRTSIGPAVCVSYFLENFVVKEGWIHVNSTKKKKKKNKLFTSMKMKDESCKLLIRFKNCQYII